MEAVSLGVKSVAAADDGDFVAESWAARVGPWPTCWTAAGEAAAAVAVAQGDTSTAVADLQARPRW